MEVYAAVGQATLSTSTRSSFAKAGCVKSAMARTVKIENRVVRNFMVIPL